MQITCVSAVAFTLASLYTAAHAGSVQCQFDLGAGGWGQHWVDIETAVVQFCESRTQAGGSRSASYLNGQIQLTTELKPGVQDSHCGQAYIDILGQCFDSSNHDSLSCTSADWISNSNADEFHWLWVSPNLWSNNF